MLTTAVVTVVGVGGLAPDPDPGPMTDIRGVAIAGAEAGAVVGTSAGAIPDPHAGFQGLNLVSAHLRAPLEMGMIRYVERMSHA